jgi:3-dehydroquinate synthase
VKNKIQEMASTDKTVFVVDSNVYNLYTELFKNADCYIYDASEKNKDIDYIKKILAYLKSKNLHRDDTVVAVGGGITGDVVGFAASMYMRGVSFVNIPTTFLSMVDSSVGGKTGVNFGGVKNMVGAFYQPDCVFIDIDFLETLEHEEVMNGFAEVIKYAAIFDKDMFYELKERKELKGKIFLADLIKRCCEIKADIVNQDEKEKGLRKLLNFGHTVGHAVEADSLHSIKHGYAVAIGMYYETLFAVEKGLAEPKVADELKEILLNFNYEIIYSVKRANTFTESIKSDKKASGTGVTIAFAKEIGKGEICNEIRAEELQKIVFSS